MLTVDEETIDLALHSKFTDFEDAIQLVRELSGIIKIDDEFDLKQAYADHLTEKYK